jgi:radical SAM-linked protein
VRVRLRFSKAGKVRWISHRDVARAWERALRRAQLPISYTEGFSPRPKVHFGLALSTGHESLAEYLDVDLDPSRGGDLVDVASLPERLTPVLPDGIDVAVAAPVEAGTDSLQHAVTSCTWHIEAVDTTPDELAGLAAAALGSDELVITRQRKGKDVTDDVRPAIVSLDVLGPGDRGARLEAELGTQPRGIRPAELLLALRGDLREGHVRRTHQWIIGPDGARREPLSLAAPRGPHAEARAS